MNSSNLNQNNRDKGQHQPCRETKCACWIIEQFLKQFILNRIIIFIWHLVQNRFEGNHNQVLKYLIPAKNSNSLIKRQLYDDFSESGKFNPIIESHENESMNN